MLFGVPSPRFAIVAAALVVPFLPGARWSAMGHRLVGRIADSRLTPTARGAVLDLLDGHTLEEVAVWADSIRPSQRRTAPWHYVNIPIGEDRFELERHCPDPPGCVISAIGRFERVLATPSANRADRAEALRFLVHFVGDMHQPLHVGDRGDRGGNDERVRFLGRATNLHSVWDRGLIESRGLREAEWFALLTDRLGTTDVAAIEAGTVENWALASHDLARTSAYDLPADRNLSVTYAAARASLIEETLIQAGVRLALLVNRALDPALSGTE